MLAQQALSRSSALKHRHRLPSAPTIKIRLRPIISERMTAELFHSDISMLVPLCQVCIYKEQLHILMRIPWGSCQDKRSTRSVFEAD